MRLVLLLSICYHCQFSTDSLEILKKSHDEEVIGLGPNLFDSKRRSAHLLCHTWSLPSCRTATSLMVQWLRLHTFTAGGVGSIPGWGTRS